MQDNELLHAVSDMLAKQLQPIHIKLDKLDSIEADVLELKSDVSKLKADMVDLKSDVTRINLTVENEMRPHFRLLAEGIGGINDKLDRTSATADTNAEDVATLTAAIRVLAK